MMSEYLLVKRELLEVIANSSERTLEEINEAIQQARAVLAREAGRVEEPLGMVERVAVGVEGMPQYLIMFDDAERPVETMFGEEIARKRYADISMSWNAHLFVKIDSNSRDAMFAKNNATVVTSPPAPVSVDRSVFVAQLEKELDIYCGHYLPEPGRELLFDLGYRKVADPVPVEYGYECKSNNGYEHRVLNGVCVACLDKVKELNQ